MTASQVRVVSFDTYAAVVLPSTEPEPGALRVYLGDGISIVSSDTLETELDRIGLRHGIAQVAISAVLDGITLTPLKRQRFREAQVVPATGPAEPGRTVYSSDDDTSTD